jgi:hypothetical protein
MIPAGLGGRYGPEEGVITMAVILLFIVAVAVVEA